MHTRTCNIHEGLSYVHHAMIYISTCMYVHCIYRGAHTGSLCIIKVNLDRRSYRVKPYMAIKSEARRKQIYKEWEGGEIGETQFKVAFGKAS